MNIPPLLFELLFRLLDRVIEWYGKRNNWVVLNTRGEVIGKYKDKKL